MLIPADKYTNKLWLKANELDNLAHYKRFDKREVTSPPQLNNWAVTHTSSSQEGIEVYVILYANERDNKDPENPEYFDWGKYMISDTDLPKELRHIYPPSKETIFKYGLRTLVGGLVRRSDDGFAWSWSSHT